MMITVLTMLYPRGYVIDATAGGLIDERGLLTPGTSSPVAMSASISTGDTIFVRGWAIDPRHEKPAAGVIVTLGETCEELFYGAERQDIARKYTNPSLAGSGFSGTIAPASGQIGTFDLRVFAVGSDGVRAFPVGDPVKVNVVAGTVLVAIDSPRQSGFAAYGVDAGPGARLERGDTLEVSGWAIDQAAPGPVRGAFLIVDRSNLVHGVVGLARSSATASPGETPASSGFRVRLDTFGLPAGHHHMELGLLDADGARHDIFPLEPGFEIMPPPVG